MKLPGQHVGSYSLTAVYSGDASNPGATSPAVTVTVGKGRTATVATAPATQAGHSVKVSVQVTPVSPAVGPVTGKVTVSAGGKKLATLTLKKGKASGKIKLGQGQHVVTFAYKGSADFGASSVKRTVTITS